MKVALESVKRAMNVAVAEEHQRRNGAAKLKGRDVGGRPAKALQPGQNDVAARVDRETLVVMMNNNVAPPSK